MNKISIIVPVYNAEKYINKCVDSVLNQTFTNWELVLVDDGSTDQSGILCEKRAETDPRIHVFHQLNGGVSSARNLGLKEATGEVVTFVDADDWLDCNTLAEVSNYFDDFDFVRVSMNYCYNSIVQSYHLDETESWCFLMSQLLSRNTILGVCSAFYKTEIIKNFQITFNKEIRNGEDWLFTCQYLKNTNNVKVIDKPFYQYNKLNEDSCTNNMSFEKSKESYMVSNKLRLLFEGEKRLQKSLIAGQASILLSSLHICFLSDSFKEVRKKINQVKQQMSPIRLVFIINNKLSFSQRIHLVLFSNLIGQFIFWNHLLANRSHGIQN